MKLTRISLAASMVLALACGGAGAGAGGADSGTDSGTIGGGTAAGRVTVLLTDAPAATPLLAARAAKAPADVRSAVVTIAQISLVGEGDPVVLPLAGGKAITTDFLTLAADLQKLVDGATVPAGTYTQLRFIITGGYLDVGGTLYASSKDYEGLPAGATVGGDLQMPSYAQSGLKVLLPGGGLVVDGNAQTLQVDFDVAESFGHGAGKSGKWVMHPVIKAKNVTAPQDPPVPPQPVTTGALAVTLSDDMEAPLPDGVTMEQFQATITPAAGGTAITLALASDGAGGFTATFPDLAPGDYLLEFDPPTGVVGTPTYAPAVPATFTVTAGETVSASFFLSGIADPPPVES